MFNNLNKSMKKIVSTLMLMVCLLFSMSTVAFANPTQGQAGTASSDDLGSLQVSVSDTGGLNIQGPASFSTTKDSKGAWNDFFVKYKKFIVGISGIGAITMVGCFIFCFIKLGASATNPQARQQALTGVLWSGVAAAGLGAVTIIVGFFYSSLRGN